MAFRFRRSVRLFPGVRLNLSRSGMSVSLGGPGLSVNVGPRGHSMTVGLPGTGISYRHSFTGTPRGSRRDARRPSPAPLPLVPAHDPAAPLAVQGEIRSAAIAALTSPDLTGLKRLINEAAQQRAELAPDLAAALKSRLRAWRKLRRRERLPLRLFFKHSVPRRREEFEAAEEEALKVAAAIAQSEIRIDFQLGPEAGAAYAALISAHDRLARSARIWDVTSSVGVDRARERSAASAAVTRVPVKLSRVADSIVASAEDGLRFENANGSDLDLFPGLLLMRARGSHDYALVDMRDLHLEAQPRAFVEEEAVPPDAPVIDHAWAKANRDGSPDRRFRDNRQIPVVRYGELRFSTSGGVTEAYHVSDCNAAMAFGTAFAALQAVLARQAMSTGRDAPEPAAVSRTLALPLLPSVAGAHELTALAVAIVCTPFVLLWNSGSAPVAGSHAPVAALDNSAAEQRPLTLGAPASQPASAPQQSTGQGSGDLPKTAATDSADPLRERVVTLRSSNLRQRPEPSAPVLRVLNAASTLAVFDRQGPWLQVGETAPAGWIHGSLVRPSR